MSREARGLKLRGIMNNTLLEQINIERLRANFLAFCKEQEITPEDNFNVVFCDLETGDFTTRDFVSPVSSILSVIINLEIDGEPEYERCFQRALEARDIELE